MNVIKAIFTLILLTSCTREIAVMPKLTIPKPVLIEINQQFKPVKGIDKDNGLFFDHENANNLAYNAKMARIYFNQSQANLKLLMGYYEGVVVEFA